DYGRSALEPRTGIDLELHVGILRARTADSCAAAFRDKPSPRLVAGPGYDGSALSIGCKCWRYQHAQQRARQAGNSETHSRIVRSALDGRQAGKAGGGLIRSRSSRHTEPREMRVDAAPNISRNNPQGLQTPADEDARYIAAQD